MKDLLHVGHFAVLENDLDGLVNVDHLGPQPDYGFGFAESGLDLLRRLAELYEVPTFRLNEAVKRNRRRFPEDFMFQLGREEAECLTSQFAMSKPGRGGRRTLPYVFTEQGGVPFIAPSMREVPLEDNDQAFQFAERLFASEFEMAILLTGVGTLRLNGFRPGPRPVRWQVSRWLRTRRCESCQKHLSSD